MNIQEKIEEFAPNGELMPGVVAIHEIKGFRPLYMSSNGLDLLGLSLEELIEMGEDYQKKVLNKDFMEDYLKTLKRMLNDDEEHQTYSIFHQVQLMNEEDFVWYVSAIKAFHTDEENRPTHTLTIAFPLSQFEHITQKAERLLEESLFFKKNRQKFLSLSARGREVLRLVALGKSSAQISEELNISFDTVNSHRKIIKQKLAISSSYQFNRYARSFDLI